MIALLLGIIPNIPGFLSTVGIIGKDLFPFWVNELYHYAWFVGFGVASLSYLALMFISSNESASDSKKKKVSFDLV